MVPKSQVQGTNRKLHACLLQFPLHQLVFCPFPASRVLVQYRALKDNKKLLVAKGIATRNKNATRA